uniref:Solute carrier family 5 member 8 n=1 Tax=Capra hircus TaxID=9925 RepID=A0A8C2N6T7_CAPHI
VRAQRRVGGVPPKSLFAGMLLISAVIGIYYAFAGGGQQTSTDFLMGGRRMTAVPVALSLTASFMSAVTVLGTPSEVYRFGAIFSIFAITYFLVVVLSAEVFLPVFYKLGITSTYEVQGEGFIYFIFFSSTVFFKQVTGFDLWGVVVATGVVCTFYCTMGGLKAVIWTDVFQVGIMVAGFTSVIIKAALIQGGISTIINDASNGGRLNFWKHTFWTIIIGGTFTWTSIYGVNQSQVQRYISCKSRFQAKLSLYINLVGLWVILVCSVLCGLALYSRYHDCDPWTAKKVSAPDQVQYHVFLTCNYPGLPGLFVACAYSGTLSTVSSSINALAAVTMEDLVKPRFPSLSEKSLSWISQGMSVLFGALCIGMAALASLMGALLQAALSIFGMLGGPLMGLFALGILVPFANSIGALGGLLAGFAVSLWVGIGAQLYPPLPERMMPLRLETYGCNSTYNGTNWMTTTEMPFSTSASQVHNIERTPLMDNWYSLSYLYFSTVGTLVTLFVGMLISVSTGGRKQNIDCRFLLTKEDFLSNFDIFKKKKQVLGYKSHPVEDGGTDNPAFNHFELNGTDQSSKINGTRL